MQQDLSSLKETYIDGLSGIGFVGNMVRFELATLSMTEKDDKGNPIMVPHERVILSPQAFLQTYGMIQDLVNRMEESKIISRTDKDKPKN